MSNNLSIHGHAYTRVFTYSEGGFYREFSASGGVCLLRDMLSFGAADGHDVLDSSNAPGVSDKVYYELQHFKDKQSKKDYWAIGRSLGRALGSGEKTATPDSDEKTEALDTGEKTATSDSGEKTAMLDSGEKTVTLGSGENLVIWDEGLGGLSVPDGNAPALWASGKALPDREQFAGIAANCFLFLDADVLRKAGALISRGISWERTATELIWQLQNNPDISWLLKAPHILIAFAEDGAAYIRREDDELKASLVLTGGSGEGTLRDRLQGELEDAFLLMTASLAEQFPDVLSGEKELRILPVLKTAETLMTSGYTVEGLQNGEYTIVTEAEDETAFEIPIKPGGNAVDPDNWCVTDNVGGKRIFDTAFEYVVEGAKAIDNLPRLSFGALTTVDRWEIEAYQNIRNLIVGYAADRSVRPLSIAVFGSPGSGKSFGVTQIAKNVLPGRVEKLEFNVSQFNGPGDLGAAFQKVRDVILGGKLPLVFFDEFDSDRDGLPRGWVKSFLMPMQDGKFKDESGEHPLGKCILVFAGGTASDFDEFIAPMKPNFRIVGEKDGFDEVSILEKKPEDAQRESAFKNIKGPDFVSRLKGVINVLGPNPKDKDDNNYILRRALLLRSLCERKLNVTKGNAPVSPNIIWAMLLVPEYKHGARSMEAILDMSRLEGNVWEPVSLPFYSQLSLHVDADAFIKLVLREVILNSYNEQLAQAIHADFVKERIAEGNASHGNAVPWDELPEGIKESNRDVARSYGAELNAVGFAYDAGDTPFPSVHEFDEATLLLLAQNQHMRFVNERRFAGWTYGEKRDNEKKTNPTLVDWDKLSEYEQSKDFDIVKNIIPLLESIGLRVYKTV